MPNTEVTAFSIRGFPRGLNRDSDIALVGLEQTNDCLNVEFGPTGEAKRRSGYVKWSVSEHASMTAGEHLFFWQQLGTANDWFILVDNSSAAYSSNSTSFSAASHFSYGGSTPYYRDMVGGAAFDDVFYITSMDTSVSAYSFNGTVWTNIADFTPDGTLPDFPRAGYLLTKHERIFAAATVETLEHRSRIRWSDPLLPTTWQAANYIDINPDDGSIITGLVGYADGIIIFKDRSMFLLSGVDEDSFTMFPVDTSVGTSSPKTVTVGDNKVFFFDHKSGIYAFDGANVNKIDAGIRDYILDGINDAVFYRAAAVYYQDKYYLSVPWGNSSYPNRTFVFDTKLQAWTEWDYGFSDAVVVDNEIYATGLTNATTGPEIGIFKLESGTDDNGAAFSSHIETAWIGFQGDGPVIETRLRRSDFHFTPQGAAGSITVEAFQDYSTTAARSITVDMQNTADQDFEERTGWNDSGDLPLVFGTFKLRFSETTEVPWQLNRVDITVSKRRRRRGSRS